MKSLRLVLLFVCGFAIAGCLEIEQRYILRADGSLTIKNDIAIDQSLLTMIAGMQKGDTSSASPFSTPQGTVTQELIDSLRDTFGGKNVAHYRTLPQVLDASVSDSLDLQGVHFRTSVTLRSYKDLYLVARDTIPGAGSMLPKDSAVFIERGDTLFFHLEGNADSSQSLASLPAPEPEPIAPPKAKSKAKSKKSKKAKAAEVAVSDSTGLEGLTSMMGNLFHFRVIVESPLLLGADTSWKVDPAVHTATWTVDASNAANLATKPMNTSVWLRKP
jgi:hypothetical protein